MRPMVVTIAAIAAVFATTALADPPKIAVEDMMVPSSDPGIEIFVRNKRLADMNSFRQWACLIFLYGT